VCARVDEGLRVRECVRVCELGKACACARVGLLIRYDTRRRHIVCVFPGSTTFFDSISLTVQFSEKKVTEYETCVFVLSAAFIWNIVILRRNQVDIVINVKTSSYKVPVILTRF
jgi:hypothetical protein